MEHTDKPKILIVDDEPRSLYAMEMLLSQEPYEIMFADNGQAALDQVRSAAPDVLLLDVMMPDMTGYEVCQHLKADTRWQHIPIILVTALDRKEDLVFGLDAGADEFLSKPVHGAELRARVRTMLRIKKQYDELQETLQLREDLANMIVHDMKSPISTLLLYTDLLERVNGSSPPQGKLTGKIRLQAHRLNSFLGDLLLLAKMRSGRLILRRDPTDIGKLLLAAAEQYQDIADSRGITLVTHLPDEAQETLLDKKLMQRVLENLISNALKFSPCQSTVTLCLEYAQSAPASTGASPTFCVQVRDQGPGVAEEDQQRIFDKYEIVDFKDSTIPQIGLGLALCKLVVDAHNGRIFVRNNRPNGAIFTIEI